MDDFGADAPKPLGQLDDPADASFTDKAPLGVVDTTTTTTIASAKVKLPATPMKITDKPLPKEPPITPRIKKKVPWKGKNIMILIPRDEDRGLPGQPPIPLSQIEVDKMFLSWRGLGYSTDGFDLLMERYPSTETGFPYSRLPWPSPEDLADEKATGQYTVVLPDLNAISAPIRAVSAPAFLPSPADLISLQ
ncbi:hypothetical protein ESCO_002356 [Escovopsis weberi]|uniref:Uncharacterized protein n=1 Tax=Escovopsis weberi TaxID=150374 RepID=A0A0M9VWW0_ESCWE|nr:hypothetical protein ESCO_002356 [Escovopsis weberi]